MRKEDPFAPLFFTEKSVSWTFEIAFVLELESKESMWSEEMDIQ